MEKRTNYDLTDIKKLLKLLPPDQVALKVGYEPKYFKKFCKKNFIQIPNNKAASCNKPK